MKMDKYIERLKKLVQKETNGNYSLFAKKAGIPVSTFQGYINGKLPKPEHLIRIHGKYNVNTNWLLTGEGEMFTKTSGVSKTPEILKKQEPDPKMMKDLFPEQTAMDIKGLEKRFDLLRQATDIDREITLGLMIKLREYLDQQIGNMRNEKESPRDD